MDQISSMAPGGEEGVNAAPQHADLRDTAWRPPKNQRAAQSMPRRMMAAISGTSNSLATWPRDE
jgi:hypothetical protein